MLRGTVSGKQGRGESWRAGGNTHIYKAVLHKLIRKYFFRNTKENLTARKTNILTHTAGLGGERGVPSGCGEQVWGSLPWIGRPAIASHTARGAGVGRLAIDVLGRGSVWGPVWAPGARRISFAGGEVVNWRDCQNVKT